MNLNPRSSIWTDVLPGERRVLSEARWPGVDFSWSVENISQPTLWTIHKKSHSVIVHFGGQIRKIDTELDGRGVSPAKPLNGDIWIVPAEYSYRSEALGATVRYAVIEFDFAMLPGGLDQKCEPGVIRPQIGHSDPFLYCSMMRLAELTQRGDDVSALTSANLGHALFLHFLGEYSGKKEILRRKADHLRFSAREKALVSEFICDQLHKPILLEHLASLVSMTSHEFLKAFRDAFDTTPAQYVINERLRRVRLLLISSTKTIATIAVETGFASHAHLTFTFNARYGMSPREFRSAKRLA
jgi:AraC family transcriptional regulator